MLADIIPEAFFQKVPWDWALWLLAAAAVGLLAIGADRAVSAAVRLARALGMSKVVIGATVVSLGTTTPETFTSVTAALSGDPGLALGNGVGSIICDTTLVLGVACLLRPIVFHRPIVVRQLVLKVLAVALLLVMLGGLALSQRGTQGVVLGRWAGAILLAGLVGYLWWLVRWSRRNPEVLPKDAVAEAAAAEAPPTGGRTLLDLAVLLVGLGLVVAGSNVMVGSARELSLRYGVPKDVLAVTVVALGTSLPELVTAIVSSLKGHSELALGNVMGADVLNVLFVIGASATAVPLAVPQSFFFMHLPVMVGVLVIMSVYVVAGGTRMRRWQGILLLAAYGGYVSLLAYEVVAG